jgi:UDP-glucose 4-epimerase
VGRNMVKRLFETTADTIIFIDDLSVGWDPREWLDQAPGKNEGNKFFFGDDERLIFIKEDIRETLRASFDDPINYFRNISGKDLQEIGKFFHFAAIVGGRAMIDGDPIKVALDLAIDSEFFYWISRNKPENVLYPSSSAAYPIDLQTDKDAIALSESDINFAKMGEPDMTYGWTKLTGEFLAKIIAKHYGVKITCIRPFSGYGEDQDLTYPVPAIAARAAKKEDPFEVWGTGKQGRDFVHIDDVLDCTLLAMEKIHDGTAINIGQGRLTSFIELIEIFTEFAGYKPTVKQLLDKPVGVHSRYCNMDYVKERLGWEPKISIREGMKRVYDTAVVKYVNKA